jgi:hypothetical protein
LAAVLALVLGAFAPSTASGATVIGSSLSNPPDANGQFSTGTACTVLETVSAPNILASPIDGVITSWSSLGGSALVGTHGEMRLRIMSPAGGGQYKGVRSGPLTTILPTSGHPRITTAVLPGLQIGVNELVAVDLQAGSSLATRLTNSGDGFAYGFWCPALPDGATSAPDNVFQIREYMYQATVESDVDHDLFGDESQDKCLGTAGQYSGCPNAFALAKPKAKGTKVKLTVTVPGAGTLKVGSASDSTLVSAAKKKRSPLKPITQVLTSTSKQTLSLTLKLSKTGRRQLAAARKLKLKIKALYTPPGGPSGSAQAKTRVKSKPKR